MKKCEWCEKVFNPDEEGELFEYNGSLNYSNFTKDLCANCAKEVIDNLVEGIYFEDCENCGKKFDLITVEEEIDDAYGDDAYSLLGNYLCRDCAEERLS